MQTPQLWMVSPMPKFSNQLNFATNSKSSEKIHQYISISVDKKKLNSCRELLLSIWQNLLKAIHFVLEIRRARARINHKASVEKAILHQMIKWTISVLLRRN
jgi:hypothetical protein